MMRPFRRTCRSQEGVTIVELVVAIVLAMIVMAIATRAYLYGNRQFLLDVHESKKLNRMISARQTAEFLIKREILECRNGSMKVLSDSDRVEAVPFIRKKFPELGKVEFRCFVVSSKPGELAYWPGNFQPRLVEYSSEPARDGNGFAIFGSVLK